MYKGLKSSGWKWMPLGRLLLPTGTFCMSIQLLKRLVLRAQVSNPFDNDDMMNVTDSRTFCNNCQLQMWVTGI